MKKRTIHHMHREANKARAEMVMTAAGLLIESARVATSPPPEISAKGVAASQSFVSGVLAAAEAGGYKHTDSLREKLQSGPRSIRLDEMSRTACKFVGLTVIHGLVQRLSKGEAHD